MTASIGCEDCFMARTHDWPLYQAGCVGCAARMTDTLRKAVAPDELKCIRDGYRLMAKQLKEAQ